VAGVARRITGRDRDGVAFDILTPTTITDGVVPVRLEAVEAALRELDALAAARPGARSLVRSLLAAECLPGREVMALAAGAAVHPSAATDEAVRRFEQACRDGARSRSVDVDGAPRPPQDRSRRGCHPAGAGVDRGRAVAGRRRVRPATEVQLQPTAQSPGHTTSPCNADAQLVSEWWCPVRGLCLLAGGVVVRPMPVATLRRRTG
jgi:hypothetical protein